MSDDFAFSLLTIGLVAGLFIGFVFGYAVRAFMSRRRHRIVRERRGWGKAAAAGNIDRRERRTAD
jgi:hypothetical protein